MRIEIPGKNKKKMSGNREFREKGEKKKTYFQDCTGVLGTIPRSVALSGIFLRNRQLNCLSVLCDR